MLDSEQFHSMYTKYSLRKIFRDYTLDAVINTGITGVLWERMVYTALIKDMMKMNK